MTPIISKFLIQAICLMLLFEGNSPTFAYSMRVRDANGSCIEKERRALFALKGGLEENYGRLSSWVSQQDCCNWSGVQCNPYTGHVEMLDLNGANDTSLRGEISSSLVDLQHLNYLDLSYNDFSSSHIPSFFGSLSNLRYLDLSFASFGGNIPYQLGNLSSLQYLDLKRNYLIGIIPCQLGNLSSLRVLRLGGNDNLKLGEGSTPAHAEWISRLSSLTALGLSYVNLSSSNLLQLIAKLPNFKSLWLSNCSLTDIDLLSLPTSDLNFSSSLVVLDFSANKLTSSIFPWLYNLSSNLLVLNLNQNHIIGHLPDDFGKFMTNVEVLTLSNNQLCGMMITSNLSSNQLVGQLSDGWGQLKSLRLLDLSNNKLSGNIPASMGSLLEIELLFLRSNSLSGGLTFLKNCTKLVSLDVGNNNFSGSIPLWIGDNLQVLVMLSLRNNFFNGILPSSLCHLTNIEVLDLSRNNLSGGIPKCFKNLTAMAQKGSFNKTLDVFDIHRNGSFFHYSDYEPYPLVMWKGKELLFINSKGRLRIIDLSSNQLSGKIPSEIGNLVGLVSLNLSRNNLSGEIISSVGKLNLLDSLDLSRNRFSGEIPASLAQITMLGFLDLSNNNLSGKIPTEGQLQSFDASVYEGNPYLCGSPLKKPCPGEATFDDPPVHQGNEIDEESLFGQEFYMSLGVGFLIGFWGVFGPILFIRWCRHAYFKVVNNLIEKIFAMAVLKCHKVP